MGIAITSYDAAMDLVREAHAARAILARALRAAGRRYDLRALLDERAMLVEAGRVTEAEQVSRTIEDIAGHYGADGRYVSASRIAMASDVLRAEQSARTYIRSWGLDAERALDVLDHELRA